jgi:hypothetical protein
MSDNKHLCGMTQSYDPNNPKNYVYNYAKYCRENENICGVGGKLYEKDNRFRNKLIISGLVLVSILIGLSISAKC